MKKKFWVLFQVVAITAMISIVGITAAIVQITQTPQTAEERLNKLLEEDEFLYGVLLAWNGDMGHAADIGGTYFNNYRSGFDVEKWREKLTNCKAMGFNMVKLWLSEGMEGIQFDDTGHVLGVETNFLKNLTTILDMAEELDLNVGLTFATHLSMAAANKVNYDFYTRFIFNPEYTKGYIDNFVVPIMNLVGEYDNILMMDIYAEPEGDIYGTDGNYGLDRGTTRENSSRFISDVGKAIKKCDPNMPITANTGWRNNDPLINGRFNELGLDYIGVDLYNDYGDSLPVKDLKLTAPAIIGEFGVLSNQNYSDDFQTQTTEKFYENAKINGYKGAFLWMYGFSSVGDSCTLVGKNGELRPVATSLHFASVDRENAKSGYSGLDKPTFIYSSSTLNIKWFGSRGAYSYTIERSNDQNTWTKLVDITSPENYEYGPYMYRYEDKTTEQGNTYYYRIMATNDENDTATSNSSTAFKMKVITCADEENLVKNHSFEDGDDGSWDWERDGDISGVSDMEIITGTPGETVNTGTKSVHVKSTIPWNTNLKQWIDVKPNTDYTYTVFYRMLSGANHAFKILNGDYTTLGGDKRPEFNGIWNYYTFDFNSGENTRMLVAWADGDTEAYVDDFYVFEKK